jgi:hypothetical protein
VATPGSSGYANLTDRPSSLYGINPAEHARLATGRLAFLETWDGDNPLDHWEPVLTGAGELTIITSSAASMGGKYLRVGDNNGDDRRQLVHRRAIPFSSFKLYRFRMRVRRAAGSGMLFAGFVGVGADGETLVNTSGSASYSLQHHFCALNAQPALNTWTEYVGVVQGWGASAAEYGSVNKAHPSVRYMRPSFTVNSPDAAGVYDIDFFQIEEFDWPGPAGLYLTPLYTGYHDGTQWRSYFDASGNFAFGASGSAGIFYSSTTNRLEGRNSSGVVQWYASGDDGRFYAGGGAVILANDGIHIRAAPDTFTNANAYQIRSPDGAIVRGGLFGREGSFDFSVRLHATSTNKPAFLRLEAVNTTTNPAEVIVQATTGGIVSGISINSGTGIEIVGNTSIGGALTLTGNGNINLPNGAVIAGNVSFSGSATFNNTLNATSAVGLSWTNLTLATGWANNGGGWATAQYATFGDWVMLKGLVLATQNHAAFATITTLPTSIRPTENRMFVTTVNGTTATRLDILSTGVVRCGLAVNSNQFVSIECIYKR